MTASFPILSKMDSFKKAITDIMKTCDGVDTLTRREVQSIL